MEALQNDQRRTWGVTTVGSHSFTTTGLFGWSNGGDGNDTERGFQRWATLPSDTWLAMGRLWHLFFAWVLVLTGLAMSPTMDAGFPGLLTLFDGRQSARTIHFGCAMTLLAFFLVHILMVVLSGPWNNPRSMITGRYAIEAASGGESGADRE